MSNQTSSPQATHGLGCPRCGGMINIPEGQIIVRCPYCDLRTLVRGERGLQRYQVPLRIKRQQALNGLRTFLGSSRAIAMDAAKKGQIQESFVAFLPAWSNWSRVIGWVFGEKQVGSGDNKRYEPREVKSARDMNWNAAACDVGEFGVQAVPLGGRTLEPFNPDLLHDLGLVFEPTNSDIEARRAAQQEFSQRTRQAAGLDRVSDVFVRLIGEQMGLVYYPIWIIRYLYNGRSYQTAVDGFSGEVLYGKAPGSVLYRALVLVTGMAGGAFVAVDLAAVLAFLGVAANDSDASTGLLIGALVCLVGGFGIMAAAFRAFRYGEEYEFRNAKASNSGSSFQGSEFISQIKEVSSWLK